MGTQDVALPHLVLPVRKIDIRPEKVGEKKIKLLKGKA